MANCNTYVRRIEFIIKDDVTICNLFMESDEPDNPFWGNGWRTKTFGAKIPIDKFLQKEVGKYLD